MAGKVYEYALKFVSQGLEEAKKFQKAGAGISDAMDEAAFSAGKAGDGISGVAKMSKLSSQTINNIGSALQSANEALSGMTGPGKAYNASMADLKAVTGASEAALEAMGTSARGLAKEFGGSAAGQIESYKLLLSRLTPEIANKPEALALMGRNVSLLSKTMGGDAVGATEAMTTAMNQFGVDLSDPQTAALEMTRMMDIMSASALAGSAEVPQIAGALKSAGLVAKNAGVSFEETNAAIQVLGKGSLYGSEAGTALRNVLATMAQGEFFPKESLEALEAAGVDIDTLGNKSLSLNERLTELQKIQGNSALMSKVFGKENESAAALLIGNTEALTDYTNKASLANATQIQADAQMSSYNEQMSRIWATTQDWAISTFEATKGMLPFVEVMGAAGQQAVAMTQGYTAVRDIIKLSKQLVSMETLEWIKNSAAKVWNGIATTAMSVGTALATAGTWALTVAQSALNAAFVASPIGWVVVGIGLVVGAMVLAYNHFEGFRNLVDSIWETVKTVFGNIVEFISPILDGIGAAMNAVFGTDKTIGIAADANSTGAAMDAAPKPVSNTKKDMGADVTKGTEGITSGGKQDVNISLSIRNLVEKMQITAQNLPEAAQNVRDVIIEEMTGALNSVILNY